MSKSAPHGTAGRGWAPWQWRTALQVLPDSSWPSPASACHSIETDFKAKQGRPGWRSCNHFIMGPGRRVSSPCKEGFTGQVPKGSGQDCCEEGKKIGGLGRGCERPEDAPKALELQNRIATSIFPLNISSLQATGFVFPRNQLQLLAYLFPPKTFPLPYKVTSLF